MRVNSPTKLSIVAMAAAILAGPAFAADPAACKAVRFSDVALDGHHLHHGHCVRDPGGARLRTQGAGSVAASDVPVHEEQGHRRLPWQLDAFADE